MLELNSTAFGGGVAEMLSSSVPFLNKLGINDEWRVMKGEEEFFQVTKEIHNLLQGKRGDLTPQMKEIYFSKLRDNATQNVVDADVVLVHDPQPLGLATYLRSTERWFWRCHIDIDENSLKGRPDLWEFINFWAKGYDAAIFSAAYYIISCWPLPKFIIPAFIDPLSEKNRELSQGEIEAVLEKYSIDQSIPIVSQIGRFDPWKGLDRTIETFELAQREENCQLIIAGGLAPDDPEGEEVLAQIYDRTKGEGNIHVLILPLTPISVNAKEINAIQRASKVIFQPSIKEGFGLTVTEALFKAKPVIASSAGGIPLQIREGETGFFFNNVPESAETLVYLLRNPEEADEMGRRGRAYVMEHFLLPQRVGDYLKAIDLVVNILGDEKLNPESIISFHPWFKLPKRKSYGE
jgi:trehalose synthase